MYFNGELLWHQFIQLDNIRRLSLREQKEYYNRYLEDFSAQYMLAQLGAAGGVSNPLEPLESTNYLSTESDLQLITENNNFIILN